MRLYLDASVLVALVAEDLFSARADAMVGRAGGEPFVSDLARAEFAAVLGRRVRAGKAREEAASSAFRALDTWCAAAAEPVSTTGLDVTLAEAWLRRFDLGLRTQDAIHVAIAERLGATLATFDAGMARAARTIGLPVLDA